MAFKEIELSSLSFNPFDKFNHEWALVTAGTTSGYNTMTVSWGGMGELWNKDVVTIYIRPQRYTREFLDANDRFTLSFYAPEHKDALRYLGRTSGRDTYKATHVGFTPAYVDGTVTFEQADLTLVCRKFYADTIKPECMLDAAIDERNYPEKDYHIMYIAEVECVLEHAGTRA